MTELENLCLFCMNDTDGSGVCPHCGNIGIPTDFSPLAIAPGTIISDRYYIGRCFRTNSEGHSYVAYDIKEAERCTVREFCPPELCDRDVDGVTVNVKPGAEDIYADCRASFGELWNKIMRLKGLTALVSVYDLFSANFTSYAVYKEVEEQTLRDYLLDNGKGYIPWDQARILFMPVLSTLGTLHTSGVVHRNINPSSFFFSEDGKLKITDYVIPQCSCAYGELESVLVEGFAPLELYREELPVGSWTDIYSFTAVIYRSLVGSTPISSVLRAQNDQMMIPAKFAEVIPPHVINAIINGMQIDPSDRTRNAEQLRSNLSASPRAVSASARVYPIEQTAARTSVQTAARAQSTSRTQPTPRTQPAPRVQTQTPTLRDPLSDAPEMRPTQPAQKPAKQNVGQQEVEKYQKQQKNVKTLKIVLIAVIVTLCIGIALVISAIVGLSDSKTDTTVSEAQDTVVVQSFVGRQYNDVVQENTATGNFTIKKEEQSNNSVPSGQIVGQSISVNTTVPKGTTIVLIVSSGAASVSLPDVTGQTYEQAYATLTALGLKCEKANKYNDGTHTANTVAETVPAVGTSVVSGDTVTIVVYSDPNAVVTETETAAEQTSSEAETSDSSGSGNSSVDSILSLFG